MPDDVETLTYKDDAPDEKPNQTAATTTELKGEGGVKTGEEGEKDKGFWDGLRERIGSPDDAGLKKAASKIAIKLGKIGRIFGEAEQFVYNYMGLNRLMKPEEIDAEKQEIAEDMAIVIETRIKWVSKFGDLINILIDVISHVVIRASRFYSMPPEQQKQFVTDVKAATSKSADDSGLDPRIVDLAKQLGVTYDEAKRLGKF